MRVKYLCALFAAALATGVMSGEERAMNEVTEQSFVDLWQLRLSLGRSGARCSVCGAELSCVDILSVDDYPDIFALACVDAETGEPFYECDWKSGEDATSRALRDEVQDALANHTHPLLSCVCIRGGKIDDTWTLDLEDASEGAADTFE